MGVAVGFFVWCHWFETAPDDRLSKKGSLEKRTSSRRKETLSLPGRGWTVEGMRKGDSEPSEPSMREAYVVGGCMVMFYG